LEALRIADESGDIWSQAHAYTLLGISSYGKGNLEEAKKHSLIAIDLLKKIKVPILAVVANECLAYIHFDMGEYGASQIYYQRVFDILRDNPMGPSHINFLKLALLSANSMMNTNIDLESMYALYDGIKSQVNESRAQRYIGEILLVLGDSFLSEAEDWIKRSIETNQRYGMMLKLAQNYVLYAELFKRKDDVSQAKDKLIAAVEIFKECGADGWVEKYEKELVELS
jgi:tetratricopeptide (TPR) repeat protein